MARTGSSFQPRFERLPLISIGTAANLVVDQAIRQRLLESLVFHSCVHVQLLAIRGEDISASGFPARALRHHGELAILPFSRGYSLYLAFRCCVLFSRGIARRILAEHASRFSRNLDIRSGLLDC